MPIPAHAGRLAGLVAVALVAAVLAFHEGGYFLTSWGVAAMLLWGLLVAAVVATRSGLGGAPGVAAVGSLAGLGLWQGVSAAWADEPAAAVNAMNLTLMYTAVLGLGITLGSGRATLRGAQWCGLGAAVVVAVGGVGARLRPGLIGGDDLPRLNTPISYWNGLGALFAFGLVLAVGLAGGRATHPAGRAAALAAGPLLALGLYMTMSRGAILLLAVMVLAVIALAADRLETLTAVAVIAAAAVPAIVAARDRDLASLGTALPSGAAPRTAVLLTLLVCMAVASLVGVAATLGLGRLPARGRTALGAAVAVVVLAGAIAGGVASMPDQGPVSWADEQFQSFKSFRSGARTDASVADQLATAAGTGRWQNWTVAWDQAGQAPLAGTGAGDYRFQWNEHRPVALFVVNAHSLYLEVLGESGLVGLTLLVLPLGIGATLVALVLIRRRGDPVRRDLVVAGAAAALIALHAAGDWDWQLPAVMIPALLLGGVVLAVAADTQRRGRPAGLWAPVAAGVAAVLAVLLLAGPMRSQGLVDDAKAQARAGDLAAALATARDASDADPSAPAPRLVQAYVLTDLGRGPQADAAFAAALARSPRDWSVMADWAGSLIARGELDAAAPLVGRAAALNPREPRVASLRRVLAQRRAAVAAG